MSSLGIRKVLDDYIPEEVARYVDNCIYIFVRILDKLGVYLPLQEPDPLLHVELEGFGRVMDIIAKLPL